MSGCVPGTDPSPRARWIEGASQSLLAAEELRRFETETDVLFGPNSARDAFRNASFLTASESEGLVVRPGASAPRWRYDGHYDPEVSPAIEVTLSGLERGKVSAVLIRDGEEVGRHSVDRLWARGERRDTFLLGLGTLSQAKPGDELEIELTDAPGEIVRLSRIRIGRQRISREHLVELSKKAWKVELSGDLRPALTQSPGAPLTRQLRVPRDGRFLVGFGVLGGGGAEVEYQGTVHAGGERTELFRGVYRSGHDAGWHDLEADLGAWAEHDVTIELSVETQARDGEGLIPVWATPEVASPTKALRTHPNIVLVSIDTLRADRLSYYGYPKATSPRIDDWARNNAIAFRNVIAPSGWTLPSHVSLMTGLEAFRHPANFDTLVARTEQFDFLAELLRDAGYRCQAFTGGGFVHSLYGFGQGFDSYVSWRSRVDRDAELPTHVARAIDWLRNRRDEPFFMFFHTFEVHTPNLARQPYFDRFSDLPSNLEAVATPLPTSPEEGFVGRSVWELGSPAGKAIPLPPDLAALPGDLYDSAVAFADSHLADLLEELDRQGLRENTIVVVTSDHGEALGENGNASHGQLYESNLRVPLLVALPGGPNAGKWVEGQVGLIDVFPTPLEYAGVEVPAGLDGSSLREALESPGRRAGRAAWSYVAATNGGIALTDGRGRKLIWQDTVWRPAAGATTLFDLSGGGEGHPVTEAAGGRVADAMESAARRLFGAVAAGVHLTVSNRSTRSAELTLESRLIAPVSVKSPNLKPPYLRWKNMGEVDLTLESGGNVTFVLQELASDEASVAGSIGFSGCGQRVSMQLDEDLAELRRPRSWSFANPCGVAGDRIDVGLRWIGRLPAGSASEVDAGLAEDLRALGYLK